MNAPPDPLVRQLHGTILRNVSRSFYLSIRLLPRRLRNPVGLAYLLARTTDTVADTTQVPAPVRAEMLADLSSAIQGERSPDALASLIDSFSPVQTNESERTLIQLLPNSLDQLARLSAPDRADVRILLENITRGQTLDLVRFADATQPRALATDLELHEYTYLVAGCVGEFWTRVCFRHVPNFSDLPEVEMEELGKRYGVGLQLINILRDAYSDLQAGRCYFPLQELEEVGLTPSGILLEPGRFEFIFKKWREEAQRGLVTGMTYVHAIHNRRIRAATALPALIGTRTLSILQAAGPMELHRQLKVPRHEVRAMIAKLAVTLAAQRSLQTMFQRYSGH